MLEKLDQKQAEKITGEDWDGNPVARLIWPGTEVALRGQFGKGFDIRGPQAWMCRECRHIATVDRAGQLTGVIQDHYSTTHGYTPALLP
jgi:hypothetical protein